MKYNFNKYILLFLTLGSQLACMEKAHLYISKNVDSIINNINTQTNIYKKEISDIKTVIKALLTDKKLLQFSNKILLSTKDILTLIYENIHIIDMYNSLVNEKTPELIEIYNLLVAEAKSNLDSTLIDGEIVTDIDNKTYHIKLLAFTRNVIINIIRKINIE